MSNFYTYFKENMDGLGLPAPEGLFGSLNAAVGNAAVLMSQIDKLGRRVTMRARSPLQAQGSKAWV